MRVTGSARINKNGLTNTTGVKDGNGVKYTPGKMRKGKKKKEQKGEKKE